MKPILLDPKCQVELEKNEKKLEPCIGSLFLLKSIYIADQTINETVTTMTDSELASFAVKAFFSLNDKMSKLDFENNLEYFEEFHARFPEDTRVIEAYAGYILIGSKVTGIKDYLSEVDGLLKIHEGKDFKIDRLQFIQQVINDDLGKAKEELALLEKYYAHEAEFDYYRAAYAWKLKDKPGAVKYLNLALTKTKNCSFCSPDLYFDTIQRLKSAALGQEGIFALGIGLNFDNL